MLTANEVKRKILSALYEQHKADPHGSTETSALIRQLGLDDLMEFWEDVRFLHDEEYIDGTPVPFKRPGYLERARITKKGIDLMDDPAELDRVLPVDVARATVDEFMKAMRLGFEGVGMAEEEKEQLFLCLEKIASHPKSSEILFNSINKCFRWG